MNNPTAHDKLFDLIGRSNEAEESKERLRQLVREQTFRNNIEVDDFIANHNLWAIDENPSELIDNPFPPFILANYDIDIDQYLD